MQVTATVVTFNLNNTIPTENQIYLKVLIVIISRYGYL